MNTSIIGLEHVGQSVQVFRCSSPADPNMPCAWYKAGPTRAGWCRWNTNACVEIERNRYFCRR
ncbi:MAG: hypothetical protein JNJ90_14515 [Saprospiraceae bacterium]|nr:hypothetical protein [Saprospiraceae bacterium]